jgi:AbrB family looped-hinge helix DNA binding protein
MILCQKAKIDNQGRIAIPKELLQEAGLSPGDYLYISVDETCKSLVVTDGKHLVKCLWLNEPMQHKNSIE